MKTSLPKIIAVAAAVLLFAKPLLAEDVDLFAGGTNTASKPNIMLMLDSSSAWTSTLVDGKSKFFYEVDALNKIIDKLAACDPQATTATDPTTCAAANTTLGNTLRLGLMMYSETGTNGGYVRFAAREMNKTNRDAFKAMLNGFIDNGAGTDNSGTNRPLGKTFFEMFKYFGGYTSPANATKDVAGTTSDATHFGPTAYAGWGTDSGGDTGARRRDYKSNNAAVNRAAIQYGADSSKSTFDDSNDKTYSSPIDDGCGKNFVIFVSNAEATTGGDSGGTTATELLTNVGGNTTPVKNPASGVEASASLADEFARFLYETDVSPIKGQQNVITYSIAVYDKTQETQTATQAQINQASSIARVGGGKYFAATDGDKLVSSLISILNEIQSINSTFVTASLPVNTNAQGEFLNQVYIGMFRPDAKGGPRWWGNIKQYRLACMMPGGTESTDCKCVGSVCPSVQLVDSASVAINNAATGFIVPTAKSYWSKDSTFWANDPKGSPASATDLPDGEVVEKGGAAQRLRTLYATSQTSRKIYTCPADGTSCFNKDLSATTTNKTAFDITTVTGTAFSASNADTFFASTSLVEPTSSTTYGSLTSAQKTAALDKLIQWTRGMDNAGDELGPGSPTTVRPSIHGDVIHSRPVAIDYGASGVVIFYASNDGLLHAIKGSQTASDGGDELWSFIAPEFYPKLNRLRVNSPMVKVPTTPAGITPTPEPKNYSFDGPITAFKTKAGKTYLYVTARRGGPLLYAFDVTDPTKPQVLWKINASGDFSNLGMTFSAPTLLNLKASSTPVLAFGGGYAGGYNSSGAAICEDQRTTGSSTCTAGKGVYFVNATTGAFIKHVSGGYLGTAAQTMDFSIPSDIYPMDSNFDGFIDRIYVGDLGGYLWRIEVNDTDTSNWTARVLASFGTDKKLFFRPAILQQKDYTAVAVGSGDREKPLATSSADGFYLVKDLYTNILTSGERMTPRVPNDLLCVTTTNGCTSTATIDTFGWQSKLQAGEKVVNSPRVAFNVMNFATNIPTSLAEGQCANLGDARSYQLDALTGTSKLSTPYLLVGQSGLGGLLPTAFIGTVKISDGVKLPVIIGGGVGGDETCVGPACAQNKTLVIDPVRSRKYRYNKVDGN